jgi:hypothetical protein
MTNLPRFFTICALLFACVLSSTASFAAEEHATTASGSTTTLSSVAEKAEPSAPVDFGSLFMPQPTNRSCTANSDCTVTGGSPVACAGNFTCMSAGIGAECDNQWTWCACVPQNVPNCLDGNCFCQCFAGHVNFLKCRMSCC